jgi:hypothetical protein
VILLTQRLGAAQAVPCNLGIDVEADGSAEAARHARAIQLVPDMLRTLFNVCAYDAGNMHEVDLVTPGDTLSRSELYDFRRQLRRIQCQDETPEPIKDLASVFLIFLDEDNTLFRNNGHPEGE